MAATDLLTLEESLSAISMTGSGAKQGQMVALFTSAISEWVDSEVGPVVVRTIENETHDGWNSSIIPKVQPVYALTSVTEYWSTTPQTLVPENFPSTTAYDYYLDSSGILHRRSSGGAVAFAQRVVITYQAGRYASTEAVGAKYKMAAAAVLAGAWTKYASAWSRGGDMFAGQDIAGVGFFDEFRPALSILRHESTFTIV